MNNLLKTRSLAFRFRSGLAIASLALAGIGVLSQPVLAASTVSLHKGKSNMKTLPNIVLVHGAWADGSSWSKVIPILQAKGYHVTAVQNPLSSLTDDVAATNRAIDIQDGPVVLVGHSWAGTVITQAGNNAKVAALVYVDAFAPDSGQSSNDLTKSFPPPAWVPTISPDAGGYFRISSEGVSHYFAQDLAPKEQGTVFATQGPFFVAALDEKVMHASWHDKPSWYVLGTNDKMIDPRLQEAMASTMKATITKVPTSHVAMLADPQAVADTIIAAANAVAAK